MQNLTKGVTIFVLAVVALFYLVVVPDWAYQGVSTGQFLNTLISQSSH
jgi:hypothetical protein